MKQKDFHRHNLKVGRNKAIAAPKNGQYGWSKSKANDKGQKLEKEMG